MSRNEHAYQSAFYAADAGMTDFLVENDTTVAASGSYSYSYGTANVTATALADVNTLATLYRVTSTGIHTAPDGSTSTRTLSRVVMFHAGGNNLVAVPGAMTSLSGLDISGSATPGQVSVYNDADTALCATADVDIAGTTVPESTFTSTSVFDTITYGEPPVDETSTVEDIGESLNIDWAAIQAGTVAPFDHTVTNKNTEWPDFSVYGPNDWPVTIFDPSNPMLNSLGNTQDGRGLLIIPGDVNFMGGFDWDGVIMVGGVMDAAGSFDINGAVMSGLNILTGDTTVAQSSTGAGAIDIQFNSCFVTDALASLGQYPPSVGDIPKTWQEAM
jgi:hypothetical protein